MTRCYTCDNLRLDGKKYTCTKCPGKEVYGYIQVPFLEYCKYYTMTAAEKKRRAIIERKKNEPIDDRWWINGNIKKYVGYKGDK